MLGTFTEIYFADYKSIYWTIKAEVRKLPTCRKNALYTTMWSWCTYRYNACKLSHLIFLRLLQHFQQHIGKQQYKFFLQTKIKFRIYGQRFAYWYLFPNVFINLQHFTLSAVNTSTEFIQCYYCTHVRINIPSHSYRWMQIAEQRTSRQTKCGKK